MTAANDTVEIHPMTEPEYSRNESIIPNAMTREEFHARWDEHVKLYGPPGQKPEDLRKAAGARSEQHMADLFGKSGWAQRDIATEVGLSPQRVAQLLTFGAFLSFSTAVENGDLAALRTPLTEFRFRSFWHQTKEFAGNDRKRYRATWELILAAEQNEAAGAVSAEPKRRTPRDFGPLRKELGKKFSDGKWHDALTIANELEVDEQALDDALHTKIKLAADAFPFEFQEKPYGRSKRYRIFKTDRQLSRMRILEELAPILDGLLVEGKKNGVTISVVAVARLGHELKTLMKKWEDE